MWISNDSERRLKTTSNLGGAPCNWKGDHTADGSGRGAGEKAIMKVGGLVAIVYFK